MIRPTIVLSKFILILSLTFFLSCGFDDSGQIGQDTKVIELQSGLDLVITTFSFGLNGQHKRVVLSKDTLREVQVEPKAYPVFSGYSQVLILDTLPAAILYSGHEPEDLAVMDQFDGKLIFKKIGGSDLFWMARSGRPNLLEINE